MATKKTESQQVISKVVQYIMVLGGLTILLVAASIPAYRIWQAKASSVSSSTQSVIELAASAKAKTATIFEQENNSSNTEVQTREVEEVEPVSKRQVPTDPEPLTIFVTGDTMVGRYVETLMNRNGQEYPFALQKELIDSFDIAVTNLEGPITQVHRQTPDFTTNFSFKQETAALLKKMGFNLVNLANNHTADKGLDNLEFTRQQLLQAGIRHFGDPLQDSADHVIHWRQKKHHLIWVGFHDATRRVDQAEAVAVITNLQAEFPEAKIITNLHWGYEYVLTSNPQQQAFAHALVDAGTDLLIGHHPHVVQEVEVYNGVPIFYSLGNYVFDQYFSRDVQEGLTIGITLTAEGMNIELLPISILRSQPQTMVEPRRSQFLQELADRSSEAYRTAISQNGVVNVPWQ